MFAQVGWLEILVLAAVGLIAFGPERLPSVAKDVANVLKQLRQMANGVRDDIRTELGPEVADLDLASLNPRTFVTKHLLADDEPPAPILAATDAPAPAPAPLPAPSPPRDGTPYDADAT